jgi:hypothetical protein
MDEIVEVELVDVARVELREALTHALKQAAQLVLVIRGDDRSCRATLRLLAWLSHLPNLA